MSDADFFEGAASDFAPTALLKGVGDISKGEVVEFRTRDHVPFGKQEPEKFEDGTTRKELVIILQTEDRNWANVVKVPKVDPDDKNSADKPGSEDDGKRAIYVPQKSNIQYAIARAMKDAGAKGFEEGAMLAVRIENLKDTGKGNPLKEHKAFYKLPSKKADPFVAETPKEEPKADAAPAASKDPWADEPGADAPAPF